MIRCIIIEDQPPAQRVLQKYVGEMNNMELRATFADALKAMDYLKTEPIDLIFLDIHLPKISGMDFLKALHDKPHVILTTAFSEYALESYEYQVLDYLLKPFSFERFVKAVSKVPAPSVLKQALVPETKPRSATEVLFIKSGYDHLRIAVEDIFYIQSEADYTEIFTSGKKHLTSHSLKHWLQTLPTGKFAQVHKSYIVNTQHIVKVSGNRIFFDQENFIPIGRAYREDFVERYLK
ncbi:LytTR family DNA-binding domain-containing protein [Arenibacter sp. F20364]|uniref:LytR/AlgR family response regulator transcription factor n=1 Tax=Arenibacter sp. F20364 TaxID=2926415 RepID=UPI001FF3389B|nr:LytTR family DNA-binding domain-containing protein [Arenibacter sp. F20364]MCK0190859.1 LytTR family DNA-binding domain-containing protein [Arenibacter sp. F20364]